MSAKVFRSRAGQTSEHRVQAMAQMNGELPGGQAPSAVPLRCRVPFACRPTSRHATAARGKLSVIPMVLWNSCRSRSQDGNVVSPDNRSPLPILNPTEDGMSNKRNCSNFVCGARAARQLKQVKLCPCRPACRAKLGMSRCMSRSFQRDMFFL